MKVGIEWVSNYSPSPHLNLPHSGENAQGFLEELLPAVSRPVDFGFDHGDASASAIHLQQDATPPGTLRAAGADMAEDVDILFFSGHGKDDRLLFASNDMDLGQVMNDEMQLGQLGRLKWFVADACQILTTVGGNPRFRWKKIFYGLRYLLGFHGDCSDMGNRGKYFAQHLKQGLLVSYAWQLACEETEPNRIFDPANPKKLNKDTTWAYLRAGGANSRVEKDKWTSSEFLGPDEDVPVFTYVRNVPSPLPSPSTGS